MSMQDNGTITEETIVVVEAPAMRGPHARRNDMMSAFSDAVRENPVPAALIGMGALWLFMGGGSMPLFGGRSSLVGTVAHGAGNVAHGAADMAQGAAHSASRMGHSIASGVTSTVGGFAEAVSDTAGRVGDYVGSHLHGVDAQSEYRNPRFDGVDGGTGGALRASVSGLTGGLQDMFERHPVALGVAGMALGAAIAASLPLTDAERETLGKAGETVRDKLGDVAGQAKDMASAAVDEVSRSTSHGPG